MPGAAIRNCGQAPRKKTETAVTHPLNPPHSTPTRAPLREAIKSQQPARALSRGSCHLRAPRWGGSPDEAAVGMCRAPALMQSLRPGASLIRPKKDADTDSAPAPNHPVKDTCAPSPADLQPAAKRKHVGTPDFCGRGGRQPSGCLAASSQITLRDARLACGLEGGACAGALRERRRREGTFSTPSLSDDVRARRAEP